MAWGNSYSSNRLRVLKGPPSYCTFFHFIFFFTRVGSFLLILTEFLGNFSLISSFGALTAAASEAPCHQLHLSAAVDRSSECYRAECFSGSLSRLQASPHSYLQFSFLLLFCRRLFFVTSASHQHRYIFHSLFFFFVTFIFQGAVMEASDLTRPASRVTFKPRLKAAGVDVE